MTADITPARSAKSLFQASTGYRDYQTFRASVGWEVACNVALLAFVESLPEQTADPSKAWDSYCKILGARAVIQIMGRLHEPDEQPMREKWPALNYEANQPKTRP